MAFKLGTGRLVLWTPQGKHRHRRGTIETLPPRPTLSPFYGVRWDEGDKTWEPEGHLTPVHADPGDDLLHPNAGKESE